MTFRFLGFSVHPDRRELLRDGDPISIEPRALDLLLYLIAHRDRAVDRDELQREVWGAVIGDAAIAQAVAKLRRALGDTAPERVAIRTVHGHGYRFVADLGEESPREMTPVSHGPASGVRSGDDRRSVAILPLANLSGDPDNQYFSDGVGEEILNLLARVPELRVASRTSSFAYRARPTDAPTIAQELDVDFVLEGSIRRQEQRVRLTVNLVDARADAQVWSEIYDRELRDIFALQSEIASAIVARMGLAASRETRRHDATGVLEAYDFYLRGRYYFYKWDEHSMSYSRQMFEKAIELDPSFARAWAGLADTLTCAELWQDHAGALLVEADRASVRALELAPDLAESRCSRGFVLGLRGDYVASAQEFDAAIAIDPMLFEAWYLYGRSAFAAGDASKAAALFDRAAEIRPDDFQAKCLQATSLVAAGAREEALAAARHAVRKCKRRVELFPEDRRAWTLGACSLVECGETNEALRWAKRALDLGPDDITVLHNVGCCYARAGLVDEALEVFEKRFALGTFDPDWIEHDPDFDNLRGLARFEEMLARAASKSAS